MPGSQAILSIRRARNGGGYRSYQKSHTQHAISERMCGPTEKDTVGVTRGFLAEMRTVRFAAEHAWGAFGGSSPVEDGATR